MGLASDGIHDILRAADIYLLNESRGKFIGKRRDQRAHVQDDVYARDGTIHRYGVGEVAPCVIDIVLLLQAANDGMRFFFRAYEDPDRHAGRLQ
ncbi:hypothetical protein TomMM35A_04590 [Sphingobium sp. TomMM35A]